MRSVVSRQQLDVQKEYAEKVLQLNLAALHAPMAMVDTYGCQQNEADSEKLRGMLAEMGYGFTSDEYQADIVILNTCAVREHAEKRVFGNVGALTHTKRANPDQIIAVCGCMAQQSVVAEKLKKSYHHVDLVFGPHVIWRLPEFLYRVKTEHRRIFSVDDSDGEIVEGLPVVRDRGVKGWLSVMYGCNNFCSYCIVPYVRGRERSREMPEILGEANDLLSHGYKDITLLGQNVNSYGRDLDSPADFSDVLRTLNELPGEFLLRFMTSHPKDAGEKLFETMASCGKVAKHIHLPFQAGSDRILKEMNRRYTASQYLDLVKMARSMMPEIVITSDVIVGFPGETEEDFKETLHLVNTVGFDALFTFIYSPRPGTPAASMPDPASKEEKLANFNTLLALQNSISEKKHRAYVGSSQRVLIDGLSGDPSFPLTARTNGGRLVHLRGDAASIGQFADAAITDSNTWALFGSVVK